MSADTTVPMNRALLREEGKVVLGGQALWMRSPLRTFNVLAGQSEPSPTFIKLATETYPWMVWAPELHRFVEKSQK